MPFLNVKITREGVTAEQKDRLIHGLTNVIVDVLGKDPDLTWVVIEEVELADWGIGGVNVGEYRRRGNVGTPGKSGSSARRTGVAERSPGHM